MKSKEAIYLIALMPYAALVWYLYGFSIFVLFGDNEPPINIECVSYVVIALIFLSNILLLKKFAIRNQITAIVSNVELLALIIFAIFFYGF